MCLLYILCLCYYQNGIWCEWQSTYNIFLLYRWLDMNMYRLYFSIDANWFIFLYAQVALDDEFHFWCSLRYDGSSGRIYEFILSECLTGPENLGNHFFCWILLFFIFSFKTCGSLVVVIGRVGVSYRRTYTLLTLYIIDI